jgi:hypothetical protein
MMSRIWRRRASRSLLKGTERWPERRKLRIAARGSVDLADGHGADAEHVAGSGRSIGNEVQHESR